MIGMAWLIWAYCTIAARLEPRALVSIVRGMLYKHSNLESLCKYIYTVYIFFVICILVSVLSLTSFCMTWYTLLLIDANLTTLPLNTPIQVSFPFCLGDADTAANFARHLLALSADPNLRSRWTNMRALHYAAYFDVPQLIQVVLQASQPGGEMMAIVRVEGETSSL